MSSKIPSIDLTTALVGTQATLDFNQFMKFNPMKRDEKAHLRVFNESGCGIDYRMIASGDSDSIPAGGWGVVEIEPNDSQMLITVTYILPNPPVSLFNATYFTPGEKVPPIYTLGNSPVGGSTIGNTLVNNGNPVGTTFVSSQVAGDSVNSVVLTNSGGLTLGNKDAAQQVAGLHVGAGVNQPTQGGGFDQNGNALVPNGEFYQGLSNALISPTHYNLLGVDGSNNGALTLPGTGIATVGKVSLPAGSLSRLVTVGATPIAQAGTSVAHSLGVVPDFVIPVHDTGGQNPDIITINFGTMSSTNFTAYTTNAGGTTNVRFLVIKF